MSDQRRRNVIPQMCDVRPVNAAGAVDWERINAVGRFRTDMGQAPRQEPVYSEEEPVVTAPEPLPEYAAEPYTVPEPMYGYAPEEPIDTPYRYEAEPEPNGLSFERIRLVSMVLGQLFSRRFIRPLAFVSIGAVVLGLGVLAGARVMTMKGEVLGESSDGVAKTLTALDDLKGAQWSHASEDFNAAYASFDQASRSLGAIGTEFSKAARFIPWFSKLASGQGMIEGAQHLSLAGAEFTAVLAVAETSFGNREASSVGTKSLLSLLDQSEGHMTKALAEVTAAEESFSRVRAADIPAEKAAQFKSLQEKLPVIRTLLSGFRDHDTLLRDFLGGDGPRLYLFLFQNNDELRPTGGFIGSYGLLDVSQGQIRNFFVNGIFDPDGQLKVRVVPPSPIGKVSAAWSLHDSNWWPDFPTSAKKAMYFYEKTGGPTVDGIVTLTPTVIVDLLRVSGPIEMKDYGVTIDADNFIPAVQEEVETKYDKEENKPKKILSDLAPILLDRLLHADDKVKLFLAIEALAKGMNEKQILLYSRNADIESLVQLAGWGGELLRTDKDYLSVVHTNLNGYKTDAVISETIEHHADIASDGSVTDTVRITRKHGGGSTPYDWWNKVNADYLRVYVPEGSQLLYEKGATWEFPKEPLDYDALKFLRDADVQREEDATVIDKSGTRISQESGKTVFGNWVYVSPGESVTVEYAYRLPFRIQLDDSGSASYSLLAQKQSGTPGSDFHSIVSYPRDTMMPAWKTGGDERNGSVSLDGNLRTDVFSGIVFGKK